MSLDEAIERMFPAEDDVPAQYRLKTPLDQREYLCAGEIRHWDGPTKAVHSPVCMRTPAGLVRQRLGSYPLQAERESLEALDAAVAAYGNGGGGWPTLSVEARIGHVQDFTYRLKEKRAEIVNLLMWEIGKPLRESEKEFDRTVEYIVETIDALKTLDRTGSRFLIEQGIIGQIRRAPLGVVLCMGPFNYPLNETFTTLIPALIMGNTVVLKPPRMGVLLFGCLLEAFRQSFPPGVVNTVYGDGATVVGPLLSSGRIDALAFIGSSRVGDVLKKQHPKPHRLRSVLGLDAKNPAIILPDADLETAVRECTLGALSFNGQRCTALKILFVHERILAEFLGRLCDGIGGLGFGMPWKEGATVTPLPDPGKPEYLTGLIADAVEAGAKVVNDGGGTAKATFFYPAVLCPVNENMRVYKEEQFGPVVPVVPFADLEKPLRYVIGSDYGQQVSLFGRDPDTMARLIDPLVNQVCRVNLNSQCQRGPDTFPFTGRKDSAEGTLSVSDALRVFSIRTLVAAKETDLNREIITAIVRERKSKFLSTDFIL